MYELIVTVGVIWLLFATKKHLPNIQQPTKCNRHHDFLATTGAFDDDLAFHKTNLDQSCNVNPATGFPMVADTCGGLDIGGNAYGCSSGSDDFLSTMQFDSISDGIEHSWD